MKCENCTYYDAEQDNCGAFLDCILLEDCTTLLPCEIKEIKYRRMLARNSQRKRRARAKEKGMCSMCCFRPARPGKKTCTVCSGRSAEYIRQKRANKKSPE